MKLALLGIDPAALDLVRAAAESERHQVVAVFEADASEAELRALAPLADWDDDWESLLASPVADAVIVGRGTDAEARADQLRKLVQSAVPLLLVHPACESIVAFELDMIRRDAGAPMTAYFPGLNHPAIAELRRMVDQQTLGSVEQLVFERSLSDRRQENVLAQFARDVYLIREILGDVRKISALGTYGNLSVQMATTGDVLARWSIRGAEQAEHGELILIGSAGQATLRMPADEKRWVLERSGGDGNTIAMEDWNGPADGLTRFAQALAEDNRDPNWPDVCRALEAADAIGTSLRRGRAIELHDVQPTEIGTFKGVMAVGGCGLLLLAPLILLVVAVVEGLELPIRELAAWRFWPLMLLAPLAIFLVLQLLQIVARDT